MTTIELESILTPIIHIGAPALFIALQIYALKDGLFIDADWGSYLKTLDLIPEKELFALDENERAEYEDFQSNPHVVGTTAFYANKQRGD